MKNLIILISFFLIVISSGKAFSENWVFVTENTRGTQFYFDKESLVLNNDTVSFNVKVVPNKSFEIKFELCKWDISLLSKEYRESNLLIYYQSGETFEMLVNRVRAIEPGSVAEQFYKYFAEKKE